MNRAMDLGQVVIILLLVAIFVVQVFALWQNQRP